MKGINMSHSVNSDLVRYVFENLPKSLDNTLEKAIGIYVLVCNELIYDSDYVIYSNIERLQEYQNVTRNNNKVVCYTVSIILTKLMNMYGINAVLRGDISTHMYVSLDIDGMIVMFDPTKFGFTNDGYNMSDLTNIKYGLMPEGIVAMPYDADIGKIDSVKMRCVNAIRNVYKCLGFNIDGTFKLNNLLEKIYLSEDEREVIYNEEGIERNVDYIKLFKFLDCGDVENLQILNKISSYIFQDIWDGRVENITIYNESSGVVKLSKLMVIYDDQMNPYYYLFKDNKLIKYDAEELCSLLIEEGWYFRQANDVDAINVDDSGVLKKLYVH